MLNKASIDRSIGRVCICSLPKGVTVQSGSRSTMSSNSLHRTVGYAMQMQPAEEEKGGSGSGAMRDCYIFAAYPLTCGWGLRSQISDLRSRM